MMPSPSSCPPNPWIVSWLRERRQQYERTRERLDAAMAGRTA